MSTQNRIYEMSRDSFCKELELDTRFNSVNFTNMLDKLDKLFLLVQLECKDFFIAGGYLRDACIAKEYNDIDVWSASQADFEIFQDYLRIMGYRKCYDSKFAETYKKREQTDIQKADVHWSSVAEYENSFKRKDGIQIIKSFSRPQERFDNFVFRTLLDFDFTINQIAYQPAKETIYVGQLFLRDILNRKLHSQNIMIHSQFIMQRVKKFVADGWLISSELLSAIEKLQKDICSCGVCHIEQNQYIWSGVQTEIA